MNNAALITASRALALLYLLFFPSILSKRLNFLPPREGKKSYRANKNDASFLTGFIHIFYGTNPVFKMQAFLKFYLESHYLMNDSCSRVPCLDKALFKSHLSISSEQNTGCHYRTNNITVL